MRPGDQILVVEGVYQGHIGTLLELDSAWASIRLRGGQHLLVAAHLVRLLEPVRAVRPEE